MTYFLLCAAALGALAALWWFTRPGTDGGFWLFLAVALPAAACATAELIWSISLALVRAFL